MPEPGHHGELLERVEAIGICGSDVHIYGWTDGRLPADDHHRLSLARGLEGIELASNSLASVPPVSSYWRR